MPDSTQAAMSRTAEVELLERLAEQVLWLSSWTIHHANHVRPNLDGLKVGGHQASSASCAQILTALYFRQLRRQDRVAVKPHASPVYHAIQYLLGRQTRENLENFRALGGAQAYPSRTKDADDVDFSTGSVGLGAAMTVFASMAQDYVACHGGLSAEECGRMVAIVGDAELDEGNVFECLLEGWKHDLRNVWWVIDYNRQSLDSVVSDRLFQRIDGIFEAMGWRVVTLKYGKRLEAAFKEKGGAALRKWIDDCPNSTYSALTFKGGAAWRERLLTELGKVAGVKAILKKRNDAELARMMTDLAGHCMETLTDAFDAADDDPTPTCFLAYTIKGFGLPLAGHQDNHAGLMTPEQMAAFQAEMQVPEGEEWTPWASAGDMADDLAGYIASAPFAGRTPRRDDSFARFKAPEITPAKAEAASTQEGFGRILADIARNEPSLAERLVTTSPDVTVSTNLGGWVNRMGVFDREERADAFREEKVASTQRWTAGPTGRHLELGIAENNLFLALAALGLTDPLFGRRLIPVGTLYDPFVARGLDALIYALYQDARFLLVGTPSGVTLSPEGGAHQSQTTPLIGMGLPNLASYEPAYVDELAVVMADAFRHIADPKGGAAYLRLSTRSLAQPDREMDADLAHDVLAGAYWLKPPGPDADLAIAAMGAVMPEALDAHAQLLEDCPDAGVLAVTSPDRLHRNWLAAGRARGRRSHLAGLFQGLPADLRLVTLADAHPATLSWIGGALGRPVAPLGVEGFGQSANLPDLYRTVGLDADAVIDAAARLFAA